jgi:hypothetical protein
MESHYSNRLSHCGLSLLGLFVGGYAFFIFLCCIISFRGCSISINGLIACSISNNISVGNNNTINNIKMMKINKNVTISNRLIGSSISLNGLIGSSFSNNSSVGNNRLIGRSCSFSTTNKFYYDQNNNYHF